MIVAYYQKQYSTVNSAAYFHRDVIIAPEHFLY